MAKKTILVDDLDGSDVDVAEHRFSIDGEQYEIDLSRRNVDELHIALAPFIQAARRARTNNNTRKKRPAAATQSDDALSDYQREQTAGAREWARRHGYEVAERGSLPKQVLDAYQRATSHSDNGASV